MNDPFASAAVVARLPRVVYRVTGERPLGYLHDVLAQDVADLKDGSGAIAALLTAEGRVAAELRVLAVDVAVLLDAEDVARAGIESHIARHAGLAGCKVEDVWDGVAVAALRGPRADDALTEAGVRVPADVEAAFVATGEVLIVRVVWGVPGLDILGPPAVVDEVLRAVKVPRATLDELDAARIAAGRPVFGRDIDESILVNETPLLTHGVSMTKGCYPGQESVARVHNLGRVRRTLRGLVADHVLEADRELRANGEVIGTISSASEKPSGGFAGIALVRA
ncbi:MAG: hypothetical protein L0206_21165, partial [Actinobacteria bacterium]|nr:hypothetical protein [Actinomycetota bacterium]